MELRLFGPEVSDPERPYLVSDAAYSLRVVGTATRNNQRWMYGTGDFGGVIETTEGCATNLHRRDGEPCVGTWRADVRFRGRVMREGFRRTCRRTSSS